MAITKFQRTVWSKKLNSALETITSLRKHCDFKFEGDIEGAKEVKILGVTRPSIETYVPGTDLVLEVPSDADQTLQINQFKYFNFAVEDIDKAQSTPGLMDELTKEATRGLTEEGDKYVASLVKAGVEAETGALAQSASVITFAKDNAVASVEDGFAVLYGKNCKVSDIFHLEIAPKVFTEFRQALTQLFTNNIEMAKKGYVGAYGNALVSIENLLPTGKSAPEELTDDVVYNILRTNKAIAFAEQINKVEAYRPEKAFSDALRALYVFGAKVVRPNEIYVMKTAK